MTRTEKRQSSRARRDQEEARQRGRLHDETRHGIAAVVLFVLAGITLLGLFHLAGPFGEQVDGFMGIVFGWMRVLLPLVLVLYGAALLRSSETVLQWTTNLGIVLYAFALTGLAHWYFALGDAALEAASDGRGGGYLGYGVAWPLVRVTGGAVALIILFALLVISTLVTFNTSIRQLLEQSTFVARLPFGLQRLFVRSPGDAAAASSTLDPAFARRDIEPATAEETEQPPEQEAQEEAAEGQLAAYGLPSEPRRVRTAKHVELPLDLLDDTSGKPRSGDIKLNSERIKKTLANFGIEVEMGEVNVGPTVTQYTLKPADGVKLAQIITLANDLALALAAHPIRIEAPIPGKSLVGIEVPNQSVALVSLKEILSSEAFRTRKGNLALGFGKDVAGRAIVADLAAMPHLLIAGATGSGKSVCINNVILSLLYQNQPDDLKFILVDPKRVELTVYNAIPHLITPVITEVNKTVNALRWSVAEMDRRYRLLSGAGARNIASYNRSNPAQKIPYLVVIIDELADLMAASANEVEGAIVRLAQMARAVGIHLIVATQRPSVDVITGLIKANITTRIAFSVASLIDSRTIIDGSGAEKLLGNGDMLYVAGDLKKPMRLQGAFVSDDEIKRVAEHLQIQADPEYEDTVVTKTSTADGGDDVDVDDDMYEEAKDVVVQAGKASASLLQRRLRIGYARAARLLDIMEEKGVIGPLDGARPREVLVQNAGGLSSDEYTAEAPPPATTEEEQHEP
ncbi:MAG: DNA translocase FtsK [Candidatus Kerfeldbacteria bacterium]|nr:DNA translocase FtsK [Candidatus Kerfeldbacteria bacterium]